MSIRNDVQLKRFRNISNNSGCVSANYNIINNIINNDIEVSHVEDSKNEFSGEFNLRKIKNK